MSSPSVDQAPILETLEAISRAIGEARKALDAGTDVDLSGLEGAVQAVCDDITAASPEDRPDGIEQAVQSMLVDLDQLSDVLSQQHQRLMVGEGINNAALNAYGAKDDGNGDGGGTNGGAA